jgi:6-phosphofructokinase 1
VPKGGEESAQSQKTDAFGHVRLGGIAALLEREIEQRTGYETRMTILGHIQRGGTPTAFDRVLATRFGVAAIDAVQDRDFGKMVALRGTDIVRVPLEDATKELKLVDPELYATAEVFFG